MATQTKYLDFVEQLGLAQHNLNTDTLRAWLSNTAPTNTDTTFPGTATDLGTGNGYTAGGEDIQNTWSEAAGTASLVCVDVVWTAAGGTIGPFRYVGIYNDTNATNRVGPGFFDYGSGITLQIGETFTLDFGANLITLA